jgi:hypothetical protein
MPNSVLKLDPKTHDFIGSLRGAAEGAGYCKGDLLIDLSGSLPGVILALDGRMPVFPQIFASYPFSQRMATVIIGRIGPQTLAKSWIITSETPNAWSIPDLQSLGVDFEVHREVATLAHPVDKSAVRLYSPKTIAACSS